ncbi:amidase [Alphaproteobacteria bacterium KMM 3653]|uniref:Amidase n=1 Tax=Harenicola maris TaxID=2841044 RepID=A0AAP2GA38_9RHOB|nr:amidase [Harenicola maris]
MSTPPKRPLTTEDIASAEALMGIAYTAQERELMLDTFDGQIAAATSLRSLSFANAEAPACRFDPRLPGFEMPQGADVLAWSDGSPAPLPDDEDDIAFAPVSRLSAWIKSGQLSCRHLCDIYLVRISLLAPKLNCIAELTEDLAKAEADRADEKLKAGQYLGPLHGIPYLVKDLFDTKGITTGWGAEPFQNRIPDSDATVVKRLRDAGAILLGKSAVGALAYGDLWYDGRCRNPWNLNEGSSGSSAGSASATAAGLCAFSIGTETLGSITSPSQRCGTTGLRPTFGRVPRGGAMALCWSMDKTGPICRSVEDTAMVLAAINGASPEDAASIQAPLHFNAAADTTGLRLGYLPQAFDDEATALDHAALEAAKAFCTEVREVSLPDLPYPSLMNIMYAEAAAAFEDLTLDGSDDTLTWQDAAAWPNIFRRARFLSAVDHIQLDRLRYRVMQALDEMFRDIDVLIGPFNTGPMLVASNFTGHPCLHLPVGFFGSATRTPGTFGGGKVQIPASEQDGEIFRVPQGISLWGKLFEEGTLLNFGQSLEAALGCTSERPTFPS